MKETITAWIARDKEGELYLYQFEPNKADDFWTGFGFTMPFDRHLFPQVKWEDKEPTKVELTIKICE